MANGLELAGDQRVVLGRRLQETGPGLLDLLLTARKCPVEERPALLLQPDIELDRLRYTVRRCLRFCGICGILGMLARDGDAWGCPYSPRLRARRLVPLGGLLASSRSTPQLARFTLPGGLFSWRRVCGLYLARVAERRATMLTVTGKGGGTGQ